LGFGVERFTEVHDINAMLTQCRTHWRGRRRLPGRDLKLDKSHYFFFCRHENKPFQKTLSIFPPDTPDTT